MPVRLALLALCLLASSAHAQTAAPLYGITGCCPNTVVTFDPVTGETVSYAEIGTEEDVFTATVGSGVLDPASRQLYLVRNSTLIAVDLASGSVTEIGAPQDYAQLAGFDTVRGRIYAFTSEAEIIDPVASVVAYTNRLVSVDPADGAFEEIAVVGEGIANTETYEGDTFWSVSGPAIGAVDPLRIFTIRNFQLLSITLDDGAVVQSEGVAAGQLLAFAPDSGTLFHFETEGGASPGPLTSFVRERDPVTGEVLTEVVVGAAMLDAEGNYEGDVFTVSLGMAVYDAPNDRVVFNRNGQLVLVDLVDGLLAEGPAMGNVGVVSFPANLTTSTDEPSTPALVEIESYPNPFRDSATLRLTLDRPQHVEIEAYDLLGRRVAVLHRGPLPAGQISLAGVGATLPVGSFVVRVEGETVSQSLRFTRVD